MSYNVAYTSCSVNPRPTSAHWGKNNLICLGNSHSVRIYDPNYGSGGKIICSLYKHTKHVNSVRWLSGKPYETELVSASGDGTIIVWSKVDDDYIPNIVAEVKEITVLADACYKDPVTGHCLFAVVTIRSCIYLYERQSTGAQISLYQKIEIPPHDALILKFSRLPVTNSLIFGIGTTTGYFMLFAEDNLGVFSKLAEIEAHWKWIHGLDFKLVGDDLLFGTTSQDESVKLWRIKPHEIKDAETEYNDKLCQTERFRNNEVEFAINLETIFYGHESWIYSINFSPHNLEVMTASADKKIIIWHKPVDSEQWVEKEHLGELTSGQIGYIGAMYSPNGELFAHGLYGSFHLWTHSKETNKWKSAVTLGGHIKETVDLAWEPCGEFLYSVGTDQTTRIHAPWTFDNKAPTWHEIARPQIHGHSLSCIAVLSRFKYTSGAEEKILRSFQAPHTFLENFNRICNANIEINEDDNLPQGAAIPSLGLSNKAVYGSDDNSSSLSHSDDSNAELSHFVPVVLDAPPTEEDLLQNTLWPEIHKLYGHVYDIYTVAATPDGSILASACKATKIEEACIRLWDTTTWFEIDKLEHHTLTVAQLAFSPNAKHLLSVSRDRRWSLFTVNTTSGKYELSATSVTRSGIHTRIIWCCAWFSNSKYFITGSRDGKVVIWKENINYTNLTDHYCSAGEIFEMEKEVPTALAIAPICIENFYLIAIGFESGIIRLFKCDIEVENNQWRSYTTINQRDAHHKTVKRLAFRPIEGRTESEDINNVLQLASCGLDGVVNVYDIHI